MLFLLLWLGVVMPLVGWEKQEAKRGEAVIVGTVFRDPGFALPGVKVELQPEPKAGTSNKWKKMKAISDSRGEFSFRIPAAAMSYTLSFQASGFRTENKIVSISGEERQDVYVTLYPAKEGNP